MMTNSCLIDPAGANSLASCLATNRQGFNEGADRCVADKALC